MATNPVTTLRAGTIALETVGFGTNRYKASFSHIAPVSAAAYEQGGENCMLGVSLGNANFEGARLEASIEWISERFERCAVVLGDTVYRLTLQLLEGLDPDTARARALEAGQEVARHYAPLLRQYGQKCHFEIIPFSAVEGDASFVVHHEQLKALAQEDPAFAQSVSDFADLYLGRGDKLETHDFAVDAPTAAAIATSYLIEESALFCCFEERGWPLLVYPGSIDSIAGLCEGRYPGAPEPLKRMAFLSLDLRKRGLYFTDGAVKVLRSATGGESDGLAESFLADATDAEWNQLLKVTKQKRFAPREEIVGADAEGRHLFLLLNGRAEVSVKRPDGSHQQIAVIESGSVFGEQAFLDGQPRSATVTALGDCEARSLSWRDFNGFREKHPDIACQMLIDIGRVLSLRGRRQLRELQAMP